ncbi:MAG: right-handed parallel beta-helix repeat-containing protein, partial [Planctomycetota bacterium]|nr:right-handed parallel beta-helix repeat-containing protein [Planctomycetota bacterium]
MESRRLALAVAVVAIALVSATAVFGEDIYVKAGADGAGTKDAPLGLLWKALDKARRGDVIHVTQGTYNSQGGSGAFLMKVPDLTLAGGYNDDFSDRNPFKYMTILERAKDYKGDSTGLPEGIIAGKQGDDHSGLIVDGFVLNSQSRNSYFEDGKINAKDSWNGQLFQANSPNIHIRNCILLNPYGDGIYSTWQGEDNEISNTFIVNTFYNAIATRSAQEGSVIKIKNCTIAFVWFQPSKGGGMCVFVGRLGKTIMEDNIFAFAQTEGGESGFAVSNTFGNDETVMKNNIFFQCQGGYYKYMTEDKQSLVAWKPTDLADINKDCESYVLSEAEGNVESDPKLKPEKDYFEKFSNFVASEPGKLNMDFLNEWRRSVGLPLQAEPGSPRKNWGMAYPLSSVVDCLGNSETGKGVITKGPFAQYQSKAAATAAKEYAEVAFDIFKKDAEGMKSLAAKPVQFKAGIGPDDRTFLLKDVTGDNYACVKLLM